MPPPGIECHCSSQCTDGKLRHKIPGEEPRTRWKTEPGCLESQAGVFATWQLSCKKQQCLERAALGLADPSSFVLLVLPQDGTPRKVDTTEP